MASRPGRSEEAARGEENGGEAEEVVEEEEEEEEEEAEELDYSAGSGESPVRLDHSPPVLRGSSRSSAPGTVPHGTAPPSKQQSGKRQSPHALSPTHSVSQGAQKQVAALRVELLELRRQHADDVSRLYATIQGLEQRLQAVELDRAQEAFEEQCALMLENHEARLRAILAAAAAGTADGAGLAVPAGGRAPSGPRRAQPTRGASEGRAADANVDSCSRATASARAGASQDSVPGLPPPSPLQQDRGPPPMSPPQQFYYAPSPLLQQQKRQLSEPHPGRPCPPGIPRPLSPQQSNRAPRDLADQPGPAGGASPRAVGHLHAPWPRLAVGGQLPIRSVLADRDELSHQQRRPSGDPSSDLSLLLLSVSESIAKLRAAGAGGSPSPRPPRPNSRTATLSADGDADRYDDADEQEMAAPRNTPASQMFRSDAGSSCASPLSSPWHAAASPAAHPLRNPSAASSHSHHVGPPGVGGATNGPQPASRGGARPGNAGAPAQFLDADPDERLRTFRLGPPAVSGLPPAQQQPRSGGPSSPLGRSRSDSPVELVRRGSGDRPPPRRILTKSRSDHVQTAGAEGSSSDHVC